MLAGRVAETIRRYGMFAPRQKVGVAVSGGQDSVFLLHVLRELAAELRISLTVLHLNHGLRGAESDGDEGFVRGLAAGLGYELICERAHLAAEGNLEQAARGARREFFLRQREAAQLDRIATGHTRSDQAETVLLRLLRGSGTAGLAGILPVTAEGIVRPLLEVSREEIRGWVNERGIEWREDSTNREDVFRRNRIRHRLMPVLREEYNPAIEEVLARTAECALDEECWWSRQVDRLVTGTAGTGEVRFRDRDVVFQADWLGGLERALGRRMVRKLIGRAKGDLLGIGLEEVDRILALAGQEAGHGRVQAAGVHATRSFGWVRLARPGVCGPGNFSVHVPVPGSVHVPGSGWSLSLEVIESAREPQSVYNSDVGRLDWARVSEGEAPLRLRNWRAGDRYRPAGKRSETKLKDLFQDGRIPSWERCDWPALTLGQEIIWTRKFGPAAEYAAGPASRRVLKITETSDLREKVVPGSPQDGGIRGSGGAEVD